MSGQEAWRFIYFFKDWGYENLIDIDWKEEIDNNGNIYKPLAVKAAKKCYEYLKGKHLKKCTFYILRFGCSFAAVNTIKPQLL